jgi:adenylate kinase
MTKKKTKKKHTKLKKTARKKTAASKRKPVKKKVTKKVSKKKAAPKKKLVLKKAAVKAKGVGRRTESAKPVDVFKKPSRPAVQAGDLQGLSNAETVDSESVGELVEEGNAFEAEVVAGVQDAGSHDEREVRTHEVPEDDVPGEYLDKD